MKFEPVILIGLIVPISIWFWFRTLNTIFGSASSEAEQNKSLFLNFGLPVGIAAIVFIGIVFVASFSLYDSNNKYFTYRDLFGYIGKGLVFVLVVAIKSVLGVLLAGLVLSYEIYFYFQYGYFKTVPILSPVLDWIFNFGPSWLGSAWLGTQLTYHAITSAPIQDVLAS